MGGTPFSSIEKRLLVLNPVQGYSIIIHWPMNGNHSPLLIIMALPSVSCPLDYTPPQSVQSYPEEAKKETAHCVAHYVLCSAALDIITIESTASDE